MRQWRLQQTSVEKSLLKHFQHNNHDFECTARRPEPSCQCFLCAARRQDPVVTPVGVLAESRALSKTTPSSCQAPTAVHPLSWNLPRTPERRRAGRGGSSVLGKPHSLGAPVASPARASVLGTQRCAQKRRGHAGVRILRRNHVPWPSDERLDVVGSVAPGRRVPTKDRQAGLPW